MKSNSRNKSAKSAKGKGNPSFRTSSTFRAQRIYNSRDKSGTYSQFGREI